MFGPHRPLHLKAGPGGVLLYWQPRAGVFPSGLSGWLDLPLSLYAPAYSLESVYINESAALPRYLKQFMVPLATENLLENTDGVREHLISVLSERQPATFFFL